MVKNIYLGIRGSDDVTHSVAGLCRKARVETARTNRIDTAEFTLRRASLVAVHVPVVNDMVFFMRYAGSNPLYAFAGPIKDVRYEEPNIVIECDSYLVKTKQVYNTDTYTAQSYETIADTLTDIVNVATKAIDDACLDGVPTKFVTNKDTIYDALTRIADATNTEFTYRSKEWFSVPAVWADVVTFYPMTMAGSTVTLEAGKTSGNEIVGRPKWTTDDNEIINNVTVLYKGGSVNVTDATSIASYGNRSVTFMRKDIDNATDADNLADAIIANYKDPRQLCECKIKQYLYTVTGGGYTFESFPYYFRTRIDDDLNQIDVSYLDCEKYTVQWPENYDIATFGKRRAFTKGYLQSMEARLYNVEKSVDQDVLTTASPTFATVTANPGSSAAGVLITSPNAGWSGISQTAVSTQGTSMRIKTDAPGIFFLVDTENVSSTEYLRIYKNADSVLTATLVLSVDNVGNVITNGQFVGKNSASDTLRHSHDAENSTTMDTYARLKTITFAYGLGAGYRVKFDMATNNAAGTSYAKICRNGADFGAVQTTTSTNYVTKSEDFTTSLDPGDALRIYAHNNGFYRVYIRNFRVYYDPDFTVPSANS